MPEYFRPIKENYGLSTVELIKLDMSDNPINVIKVDGKDVLLPVLNLGKYDPNCRCYAFVERLKQHPITMIDMLYSYGEIDFENEIIRNELLKVFTRYNIDKYTMNGPGFFYYGHQAGRLNKASKSAVNDSYGKKAFVIRSNSQLQFEVEKEPNHDEIKDNGLILELVKSFYEMVTFTKLKRPTDPIIQKINCSIFKDAVFIKSGEIITRGISSSKYFSLFRTEITDSEKTREFPNSPIQDSLSMYLTGVDDSLLATNFSYLKSFFNTILYSHILEALSIINQPRLPKLLYAGKANINEERIEVNPEVGNYFQRINEMMFPKQSRDYR